MILTLKDKKFKIETAELSAAIPDPYWSHKYNPKGDARLFWSLNIECEQKIVDDEIWKPTVYHENLHFPISRWMEIVGQKVEWSEPVDDESGEPNGGFYVFEHENIARASLQFLERKATRFRFAWEGVCDVLWNKDYGRDVPFKATGWATFTGLTVRGSESDTDKTIRSRLTDYLDPSDFKQGPLSMETHPYQSGVKAAHADFTPIVS